jgi:integrase
MLMRPTPLNTLSNISGSYQSAYECWQSESAASRSTTRDRYSHTLKSLAVFLNGKPIQEISRKDISDFADHLIATGNSPVTSKQKIGILKTVFNSAINKELLDKNPTDHFKLPYKRPHKPRVGFTPDNLNAIFQSPIYTQGYLPLGGGRIACFWLPLLALFTGARLEELAQLRVSDVKVAPGLGHYLVISDLANPSAQLKNAHSRRHIPLHAVLIACGFLRHVAERESGFLFPDLRLNARGKRSGYFSHWFSGYLRKKVGIHDTRKVFHSFRHTFKDQCRAVGIEEAIHDALTGHTSASASRQYGNDQFPLEPLFKAMAQFDLPDIDLTHLMDQPLSQTIKVNDIKVISAFYGLAVGFPVKKINKASEPILIAVDQTQTIGINLCTRQIAFGELLEKKWLLLQAWIQIHLEELLLNWETGKGRFEFFPVDPLR